MSDYDFSTLNDKEFEILATDLLSKRDNVKYERFKPGRDAGVDGRFFHPNGTETILQAKHWPSSSFQQLRSHIEKTELPKIKKLQPSRYILIVSNPLSRNDKANIQIALSPYVISPSDILGREDLNDLLSVNRDIEMRHYKLWIKSTNVLQYIINKPVYDRSIFSLQEIQDSAHVYVRTKNHELALKKLQELGTVIITGPAGIGKTTLANHLSLHYVSQGFTFIQIAEEIKEAETLFNNDEKQIFYFDDFLGRNYLEALNGHEGSHIVQFIKRISRNSRKKFILTSRTTILNQGKILMDVFQQHNIEHNEFEVSFDSFSKIDKAKILYNHIWHSSLETATIDQIYHNKRYRKIIEHNNYNPRLINYITDNNRLKDCHPIDYWQYVQQLLDNPATVWENPFEAQHDDCGRAVILLVTLNARPINQSELSEAFSKFIAHSDSRAIQGRRDYIQILKHLVGSMLTRTMLSDNEVIINLFNPSIGDYVLHRYKSDIPSLRAGFCSLNSTSSIRSLLDLATNKFIDSSVTSNILHDILKNAYSKNYLGYSPEYISLVLVSYIENLGCMLKNDKITFSASDFVVNSKESGYLKDIAKIFYWRIKESLSTQQDAHNFITRAFMMQTSYLEIKAISELMSILSDDFKSELYPEMENFARNYFVANADDLFPLDQVFDYDYPDNEDKATESLFKLIQKNFNELKIPLSDDTVESIVDAFDIYGQMSNYFDGFRDEQHEKEQYFVNEHVDEIDDLFERDINTK
ncbi:restriction endonuclease [Aeromonas caviae]